MKIILLMLFPVMAFAQNYDLGGGLTITQQQVDQIQAALPHTDEDLKLYHWADVPDRGWRWIKQGYVDKGEVDFLTKPSGTRQNYGGGIYTALHPTAENGYGPIPVMFEVKKGALLYHDSKVYDILGQSLSQQQISELGRVIPFVHKINNGEWAILTHPDLTSNVSYAGRVGALAKSGIGMPNLMHIMGQLEREDQTHFGYLDSFAHLTNFLDGVSFVRAVRTHPDHPWGEFEPQNFERFRNTEKQLMDEMASGKKFGFEHSRAPNWVDKQMAFMDEIHASISGHAKDNYRSNAVIGGGDSVSTALGNSTAEVSDAQKAELAKNVYLRIEDGGKDGGTYRKVRIHYPTLEDFERLQPVMSPEMYQEIKAAGDLTQLAPAEHAELTREMLRDLVRFRFREYQKSQDFEQLFNGLVSIHAYPDFNGRSIRLQQRAAAHDLGKSIPYYAISDLDLLAPKVLDEKFWNNGSAAYEKWLGDMLHEAQRAKFEGRVPKLIEYRHEARIAESLSSLGGNPTWTQTDYKMIASRQWADLLDRWIGPKWQEMHNSNLTEILKNPGDYIDQSFTIDQLNSQLKTKLLLAARARQIDLLQTVHFADPAVYPAVARAYNEMDDNEVKALAKSSTQIQEFFEKLLNSKTFASLDPVDRGNLAVKAFGHIPLSDALSDDELAKIIRMQAATRTPQNIGTLTSMWNRVSQKKIELGPNSTAALSEILEQDMRGLSKEQETAYRHLWERMLSSNTENSSVADFLKNNFEHLSSETQSQMINFLSTLKPSMPLYEKNYKDAISAVMKQLAKDPAQLPQWPGFGELIKGLGPSSAEFLGAKNLKELDKLMAIDLGPKSDSVRSAYVQLWQNLVFAKLNGTNTDTFIRDNLSHLDEASRQKVIRFLGEDAGRIDTFDQLRRQLIHAALKMAEQDPKGISQIHEYLSAFRKIVPVSARQDLGSENIKLINSLLTKDFSQLDANQRTSLMTLWKFSLRNEIGGPEAAEFPKRIFDHLSGFEKEDMAKFLLKDAPKTPEVLGSIKNFLRESLKQFRTDPKALERVPSFHDLLDVRALDKRDLASFVQGLRNGGLNVNRAFDARLANTELNSDEARLLEREVKKIQTGRAPLPNSAYDAVLSRLAREIPDSSIYEFEGKKAVDMKAVPRFLESYQVWPKSIREEVMKDPDQYRQSLHHLVLAVTSSKTPPPDIDQTLVYLWKNSHEGKDRSLLIRYAATVDAAKTPLFDEQFLGISSIYSHLDGFSDLVKSRPDMKADLIRQIEHVKLGNYAAIARAVEDNPAAIATLVRRIGNRELEPLLATSDHRISGYEAEKKARGELWEVIKGKDKRLDKLTSYWFSASTSDPKQLAEHFIGNKDAFKHWFKDLLQQTKDSTPFREKFEQLTGFGLPGKRKEVDPYSGEQKLTVLREAKPIILEMLSRDKLPGFITGALTDALVRGNRIGEFIHKSLTEQRELKPWQVQMFRSYLKTAFGSVKFHGSFDLFYHRVKTPAARQMAEMYRELPGFSAGSKKRMAGQIEVFDHLKKIGVDPADLRSEGTMAKVVDSVVKDRWSSWALGYLARDWEVSDQFKSELQKRLNLDEGRFDAVFKPYEPEIVGSGLERIIKQEGQLTKKQVHRLLQSKPCRSPAATVIREIYWVLKK